MTTVVDSTAHFGARLLEGGIGQGAIDAIKGAGVDTLSRLAFAVGQPNTPLSNDEVSAFLQGALGRPPSLLETTTIKRIAFEGQTYLVASLRQNLEQTDDSVPRKIAFAERNARMNSIKAALMGINIQGEFEPAHLVLDKACALYEKNVVTYLEPASCVSRTHEVQGQKQSRELSLEKGSLVLKHQENLHSPTDSEIKFSNAMMRRGIALQFARIMSHSQHMEWTSFLFDAIHRDPPPGYSKPALAQLIQCDRAAWARLASSLQSIRQAEDGSYPFGKALLDLRSDPYIVLYLAPVARASNPSGDTWNRRASPYSQPQHEKGGKGKRGKGKKGFGKGPRGSPAMPKELHGKWRKNSSGDPVCFAYNTTAGCSEKGVKPGDRCLRGLHVCAEPRCQQAHALHEHGSK